MKPPPALRCASVLFAAVCLLVAGALGAEPGKTTAAGGKAPDEAGVGSLAEFADAANEWGRGVEAVIENAYRQCFRTYIIAGRILTLRVPFAQDEERSDELAGKQLTVTGSGKADPAVIWKLVDKTVESADFRKYVEAMEDGREKMVIFDLQKRSWSVRRDWYELDWMKAGVYLGHPHLINVLSTGRGVSVPAIYDYLYSISRVGMDCSGFVWWVLKSVARAGGVDLDAQFRRYLGAPSVATVPLYVGAWFFDPRNRYLEVVKDEIRNLQPGDVIAFRKSDGTIVHSAVIQSVDLSGGTIRYLQSTDEAPRDVRGVHESMVAFDPAHPEVSLKDRALYWHQKCAPPFVGEADSGYVDDGERYRAHPELGGGAVVRLRALKPAIDAIRASAARKR